VAQRAKAAGAGYEAFDGRGRATTSLKPATALRPRPAGRTDRRPPGSPQPEPALVSGPNQREHEARGFAGDVQANRCRGRYGGDRLNRVGGVVTHGAIVAPAGYGKEKDRSITRPAPGAMPCRKGDARVE